MNSKHQTIVKRSGFLLMEALLAFSIFGIAVTSIVIALHRTSELSQDVVHAQWIKQEAQSILTEIITTPQTSNDFERDETFPIDEFTDARVVIEPHESENQDGDKLDKLYNVTVTLYWDENGTRAEESFSTIHNSNMFHSAPPR